MKEQNSFNDTYHLTDSAPDILSHPNRKDRIHILTLDTVLAADIYERIYHDPRTKHYRLIKPQKTKINETIIEIESMAQDTVSSKLLIIDVRKDTLPMLQKAYNKIVGYNRRDLNKLCYTLLIGDGPVNLFQTGKSLDVFVPHLSSHRIDYQPAVFFYDPFIHYEPGEIQYRRIDSEFMLPEKLPKRLAPYFQKSDILTVDNVRCFLRATDKTKQVQAERLQILIDLYKKRITEQFTNHKERLKTWLSKDGIRLASEKLHLYPLFFEDWVYDLMQKASQ